MQEITSKDIINRFKQYANSKGYLLKVAGEYAYRNKRLEILRYGKYNREDNTITVYVGKSRYRIPFVRPESKSETTFQKSLLRF